MSEASVFSTECTQDSQNDDSQDIENSVRVIIDNYLSNPLSNEQTNKVYTALQVAATSKRHIFQRNAAFLDQIVQKLLTYCINVLQKNNQKSDFIDNITIEYISIYPAKKRDLFIHRLILAIQDYYLPETQSKSTVIMPSADDKFSRIDCNTEKASFFYLTLFYKLSQRFPMYDGSLLILIQHLLCTDDHNVQLLTMKILSEFVSISMELSFRIIRILLSFITNHLNTQISQEDFDPLLVTIFNKSYNNIPPQIKPLIGREVLSYLPQLCHLTNCKIIDLVFRCVQDFITIDQVNAQLSASFFLKLFREYYLNKEFIKICKNIVQHSPNFKSSLWKQFSSDFIYLPALLYISPDFQFDLTILNNVSPPILYDIVVLLDQIPEWLERRLSKFLVNYPPKENQIKLLIKFIPAMPQQNYHPDLICKILSEDEGRISSHYQKLKKFALEANSIKLASLLAAKYPEDQAEYSLMICNHTNSDAAWEDENFRRAVAIITSNAKKLTFKEDYFIILYGKSKLRLMYLYAQERALWKPFLKPVLQAINDEHEDYAIAAISVLHMLENFQEIYAYYSYYFFKHVLSLLNDKKYCLRFKNVLKCLFPQYKLIDFAPNIIPILIRNKDTKILELYSAMCNEELAQATVPAPSLSVEDLVLNNISSVYLYLFVYIKDRHHFSDCITFLQNLLGKQPTKLLNSCIGTLAPQLLLYLASDEPKLRNNAKEAIKVISNLCFHKKFSDTAELMKYFWSENFLVTIIDFCRILYDNASRRYTAVLKTLITSVEYIEPFIHSCYPKILSITDIAMRRDSLRSLCIELWQKLMSSISDKSIFPSIFGHVISQLLPYFDQFPDQITDVLRILIIENSDVTQQCFIEIAHIPLFLERPQLSDINKTLQNVAQSDNWKSRIVKLSKQLESTAPPFRRLILQQLFLTLKANICNLNELSAQDISELMKKLWIVSSHEKISEHILYCAQCMSLLPFDKEVSPPEHKSIESDHNSIIITIITDYLVKILEDSSSFMNHDHAALAIQELLKVIGCSAKATEDEELLKQDSIWNCFPGDIQNIIFPFLKSRYRMNQKQIELEPIVKTHGLTVNKWLCNLTQYLLQISTGSTQYFKHCSCVLPDSPSLCKFFLPYLCRENLTNEQFRKTLRKQWKQLMRLLNGGSAYSRDFARQALQILFSLFDTLASLSISVGEKRHISNWPTLGIASESQLADAAFQCELYQRSLQHIELDLHDGGIFEDRQQILLKIYQHIDDPDGLEFLSRSKQNDFDDAIVALESQSLAVHSNQKCKLDLIHEMLLKGRYERALSDAILLKNFLPDNVEVNALIAKAAIRLQRWDEMSKLTLPDVIPPNHRQDAIDIITARLLYFRKIKDRTNFDHEVKLFGSTIVPLFSSAAMVSYFRLIPLLVQIRLVEEIEEFNEDNMTFSHWENDVPMKPIDLERIVSVRSALIGEFTKDKHIKSSLIAGQWLQLARYCRKSMDLLNSKVFCSRAKIYVIDQVDQMYCSFEMAKIYWELDQRNAAQALLKQICPENDNKLFAKVKYLNANWAELNSSSDLKTISETYQESLNLCQTGKAHLAIATAADHRIIGFTTYLEELAQESRVHATGPSPSGAPGPVRRATSKFWSGSLQPISVMTFLNEQIPLALSNYMKSMLFSPQYSYEVVPRVLVLFFDIGRYLLHDPEKNLFHMVSQNHKNQILKAMKESILNILPQLKSSIWVNSITQLISRIEQPTQLVEILHRLIQPALQDYPQATFWHLMSIYRSNNRRSCFSNFWDFFQNEFRAVCELKEINDLKEIFNKITGLLLELIKYTVPEKSKKTISIQASDIIPDLLKEFENSNLLMPLSSSLIIQPNTSPQMFINSIPRIQSMNSLIQVFPSLQNPKRISVLSTTGKTYYYLCKRDDDLRKDMRMMEFGSFVSRLLARDKRCKQRNLSIVTFAVICLDERSGIIEWVENTEGLRNILEKLYRPLNKGIPTPQLRQLFCDGVHMEPTMLMKRKQQNFVQHVLPAYPPVMHLFFASTFRDISRWLQARLTYTRSIAVWSMVGYVVGLGDRHAENILFSKKTGACLHVDFSVLFDKGKTLNIPECVPFRLTQNIVDGMGVLGTDGAFSAASTLVMEILREKKHKIVSVLQTFIHDPLIEWKGRDGSDKNGAVVQAKLTLKEVERRLSGIAEDKTSTRSPECVVQELIKQATDNNNLALMFIGWQPYL
ncbi:PIKK family atypical protein kinase [Tritrichomonas foetus]|uniref:Serine/threonine-protein kinase ATR n=1 Tax=Tritrichomonas foetus TaxID=1144522 RepID=A0A1J4K926_9EUKA|nr:PIKK family atypical protein kinase [Tritrichomonas foetus]|eukprot:OHT07911.1 PIKK family atypical protein kinase [Tritrichomonas foetus]